MSEIRLKPRWYPGLMRLVLVFLSVVMISCSQSYLDKAAAEPGAVKTSSGLVYRELKPGSGPSPMASDTVKVNYRGTLVDGTEFDSSYNRNEPISFPLNGVIPLLDGGRPENEGGRESPNWYARRALPIGKRAGPR